MRKEKLVTEVKIGIITMALFINATEDFTYCIAVCRSANLRYFNSINKVQLPVTYFSQNNAWMGRIRDCEYH